MGNDFIVVSFAVVDTNVIVSSMVGDRPSATKDIMKLIEAGNIITLFDGRMMKEYVDVMRRFFSDGIIIGKLSIIAEHGYLVNDIVATKEYFKDKSDIPFFEVKESSKELDPYLITGNPKDYPDGSTRSAAFVVDVLKYLNGFVLNDKERYLSDIKDLIDNLDTVKYQSGKDYWTNFCDSYMDVNGLRNGIK